MDGSRRGKLNHTLIGKDAKKKLGMDAACAAETPAPVTVCVESSASRVCGKIRQPPPPRRLHDDGMVQRCGWVDILAVVMERRSIASCVDVVLMMPVS